MEDSGETAATIAELADRLAGQGKQVAGATQAEVLWQIAQHADGAARGDIAARSGLSTATVSKAVAILIDEGLVDDGGQGRRRQRPGTPLTWTDRYAAAGVVITTCGGRPVEFIGTVTRLNGTALPAFTDKAKRTPISLQAQEEADPRSLVGELGEFIETLLKDAATPERRVLACGVSVGGHVDGDRGIIRKSFNTGWKDDFHLETDLGKWLNDHHQPLDVVVQNDVTSFTVHKNLTSAAAPSYVLVAIYRDGIGGGVVVKGRTRRGHDGLAGELGHIYVGSRGDNRKSPLDRGEEPLCRCRKVGCLEAWAVPLAIFSRAHPERAVELAPGEQTFEDLFQELASRSSQTDTEVAEIFREAGTALGRGLADVILWINPAKIFLYLPPALATDNRFLAGKSYMDAVHAELSQVFSIGDATPLELDPMTELELEELGAKAAASNVLRKLLITLEDSK